MRRSLPPALVCGRDTPPVLAPLCSLLTLFMRDARTLSRESRPSARAFCVRIRSLRASSSNGDGSQGDGSLPLYTVLTVSEHFSSFFCELIMTSSNTLLLSEGTGSPRLPCELPSTADSSSPRPREMVWCGRELMLRYFTTELVERVVLLLGLVLGLVSTLGSSSGSVSEVSLVHGLLCLEHTAPAYMYTQGGKISLISKSYRQLYS